MLSLNLLATQAHRSDLADQARRAGVLMTSMGPDLLRATTHLGVDAEAVEEVGRRLRAVLQRVPDPVSA